MGNKPYPAFDDSFKRGGPGGENLLVSLNKKILKKIKIPLDNFSLIGTIYCGFKMKKYNISGNE
jgi:hypothetical protein